MDYKNKKVWIIGCSSGIGAALAKELAANGAQLALSARNEDDLRSLENEIEGEHIVLPLDISDPEALQNSVKKLRSKWQEIDIIVNLAAIYCPGDMDELEGEQTKKIVEVNVTAAFYLIEYALPWLTEQDRGQLTFCASVAGYNGLPGGQPYSATKAAVINLVESLYGEMRRKKSNVEIKLINPGFVKTKLTDKNDFEMPMIIEVDEAARAIAKGMLGKSFEIHFPKKFTYIMKFLAILPYSIYFWLVKKLVK